MHRHGRIRVTFIGVAVVAVLVGSSVGCQLTTTAPPVRSPGKWAVVLCQVKHLVNGQRVTDTTQTASLSEVRRFYGVGTAGTGGAGVAQWFHDVSRGAATMAGSTVFPWSPIDKTADELTGLSRRDKALACAQASSSTRDYTGYAGVYAMFNETMTRWSNDAPPVRVGDSGVGGHATVLNGKQGSWGTVMDGSAPGVYFAAHEILHSLGYGHSFNENTKSCAPWGEGGEYCDNWDIMSASTSINALTMEQAGWIPKGREVNALGGGTWLLDPLPGPKAKGSPVGPLVAINPDLPGHRHRQPDSQAACGAHCVAAVVVNPISIYIPIPGEKDARHHFTVEFHNGSGWDAGISSAVLVHEARLETATNGQVLPSGARSRLMNDGVLLPGKSQNLAGYKTSPVWCRSGVEVTVTSLTSAHALVTVRYKRCPQVVVLPPVTTPPVTVPASSSTTTTMTTTTTTTTMPPETTSTTLNT